MAGAIRAREYPGSSQVDVVGLSGFNGGTILFTRRWRPFASPSAPRSTRPPLAPDKPVALTEVASAEQGGDKAAWISGMFAEIRRRPYIRSLVWFNLRKEADWRIESSPAAQAAFAEGAASLREDVSAASR